MANFNKVILVGRLTRNPEAKPFLTGGMVTKFGFAVTNRKKNAQSGQWEDEPMFIDCEVFNRGETGKLADLVRDRCRKGSQLILEGRLKLDQWDDKATGQKRSKHMLVVDTVQLLDPRPGGMGGDDMGGETGVGEAPPPRSNYGGGNRGGYGGGGGGNGPARGGPAPRPNPGYSAGPPDDDDGPGGDDKEIPF